MEESLDATAGVEEGAGEHGADALEDEEARAGVDVGLRGTFEEDAKGDDQSRGDGEVFHFEIHKGPLGTVAETRIPVSRSNPRPRDKFRQHFTILFFS